MCPLTKALKQQPAGEDRKTAIRGLRRDGPVLLSYGFRPFFLGGGLFAALAMGLWLVAIDGLAEPGGSYGATHWHAHEMLFGFAPAILAGFLLTAIPNWTGRLPVSGRPLAALFALWLAGRLAMLNPDLAGLPVSAAIDMAFLPAMLLLAFREIAAGRKWKDLKILFGLVLLSAANGLFHLAMLTGNHPAIAIRLSIAAYTLLVMIIGGRIIPSFTRNYMAKQGRADAPVPFNRFDGVAILAGAVALAAWVVLPENGVTLGVASLAAAVHAVRLTRWKGLAVRGEMLLLVLHASYLFVPLGFAAIALGAAGLLDEAPVLHVLTIGVISTMMLAVMTRASRGHTGRALTASPMTRLGYGLLFGAALARPAADLFPDQQMPLLYLAGLLFASAFAVFGIEHFPMLATERRNALKG